jgi:hypothetical protein
VTDTRSEKNSQVHQYGTALGGLFKAEGKQGVLETPAVVQQLQGRQHLGINRGDRGH